jgi:hypothetical protein
MSKIELPQTKVRQLIPIIAEYVEAIGNDVADTQNLAIKTRFKRKKETLTLLLTALSAAIKK